MVSKLINLIALAALTILASTHGAAPVSALSVEHHNVVRHNVARHDLMVKRQSKTANRRRCRAPSSSAPVSSTRAPAPTSSAPPRDSPKPEQPRPSPQQPAPAPPPPPAPAPPPPPPSGGKGKVGIAWANPNDNELANFLVGKTSAVYTWSPFKPAVLNNRPDIDFLPMLWGTKHIGDWRRVVRGYARYALGFNEPDQGGQANLNAWHAADLWMQHIQPLKSQGYTLVSPACTNAPAGTQWLRDFVSACNSRGCTIDIVATHWYGTQSQHFIDHVENIHNIFNKEVWVTEFACQNFSGGAQCSPDQVWNFLRTVTNWMDNTWFVGRYFAFGVLHDMYNVNPANQLINNRGQPNDLGYEYLY